MRASRLHAIALASATAFAAAGAMSASPVPAGVVVISRESSMKVDGFGQETPFVDEATFSGPGTFNDTVSGEEGTPPDGGFARGSASQNTTITYDPAGGPLTGSGRLAADAFAQLGDSLNVVQVDNQLEIVFQVLENNEPFRISGTFDDLDDSPATFVALTATDPTTGIFEAINGGDVTEPTFDSGTLSLPPATYRLTLASPAGSSGTASGEPFGESNGLDFALAVGDAIEPPPPVIPLPAGVWPGLVGLAAAAGAIRKSRGQRDPG
jgi:hypothetical protein